MAAGRKNPSHAAVQEIHRAGECLRLCLAVDDERLDLPLLDGGDRGLDEFILLR